MKDANAIARFVVERIGHIYERPRMYGGTPEGVDLILHYFHETWAEILECQPRYDEVRLAVHSEAGGAAMGFATSFRQRQLPHSEDEVMEFVVLQWRAIDKELGLMPDATAR
jgi:hypothetical protein